MTADGKGRHLRERKDLDGVKTTVVSSTLHKTGTMREDLGGMSVSSETVNLVDSSFDGGS